MALYTLDDTKLRIEFVPADGRTVHGGQVAVAALCKRLGLWKLLRAEPALDPRTDKKRGYAPEVMAARIIVTLCCGGVSLADAERLQADQGLKRALGVKRFADQTQLGEWLRGLGPAGVTALRRVLGRVAAAALALCPAGTVLTGGELEIFFDDTQLEVTGKKIEGAALNYEGKLALGWQALFVGPFLADQLVTGDNTPVSQHLPDFLAAHAALWRDTPAYFFADSASSEGKHLDLVRAQFPKWSILSTTAGPSPSSVPPPPCPPAPGPQCRQTGTTPTCATSRRDAPGRKSTPCAAGAGTANSSSATPSAPARTAPANPAPSATRARVAGRRCR